MKPDRTSLVILALLFAVPLGMLTWALWLLAQDGWRL